VFDREKVVHWNGTRLADCLQKHPFMY
jgi:hypothetical protein